MFKKNLYFHYSIQEKNVKKEFQPYPIFCIISTQFIWAAKNSIRFVSALKLLQSDSLCSSDMCMTEYPAQISEIASSTCNIFVSLHSMAH